MVVADVQEVCGKICVDTRHERNGGDDPSTQGDACRVHAARTGSRTR
jgi:hypothetical protein